MPVHFKNIQSAWATMGLTQKGDHVEKKNNSTFPVG